MDCIVPLGVRFTADSISTVKLSNFSSEALQSSIASWARACFRSIVFVSEGERRARITILCSGAAPVVKTERKNWAAETRISGG
jgi:hypothetical protein